MATRGDVVGMRPAGGGARVARFVDGLVTRAVGENEGGTSIVDVGIMEGDDVGTVVGTGDAADLARTALTGADTPAAFVISGRHRTTSIPQMANPHRRLID